jgi:uncharacterized membrane protein
MTDTEVYVSAAAMGAAAGMRSMAAPAIVSHLAKAGHLPLEQGRIGFLGRPSTAKTMAMLAAGELIADKLPFVPKRTKTPSLIVRTASGALSGSALASSKKRSVLLGALLGAAGAVAATYGAYALRKSTSEKLHIPDPIVAVIEDAVVATCAYLVITSVRAASEA